MDDKLRSMQVFVLVATSASFAAAAEQLGMSAVMVGKHVQKLERQLGARLLERTTRTRALTEIGISYLERCRDVLASVEAADRVAETVRAEPQGRLRISAPVAFGSHRLVQLVADYRAQYPKVSVELALNDRVVDLAEESIDVAFRSGIVSAPELVARPLARLRVIAAASPAYIARCGAPEHPDQLREHDCLGFAAWGPNPVWRFSRDGDSVHVAVRPGFVTNHVSALVAASLAGMGVLVQHDAVLEQALRSGQLVQLLPDWELPSRDMHIVRRQEPRPSAKVRSFVDFALAQLGAAAPQSIQTVYLNTR